VLQAFVIFFLNREALLNAKEVFSEYFGHIHEDLAQGSSTCARENMFVLFCNSIMILPDNADAFSYRVRFEGNHLIEKNAYV
jgi:hypothetical protein